MRTQPQSQHSTEHTYSYNAEGYAHDDDCLACLKATGLHHEFEQDRAEMPGICRCGDIEFVHQPQTIGRLIRRVAFNVGYAVREVLHG